MTTELRESRGREQTEMRAKIACSIVLITRNEEQNLIRLAEWLKRFREVIVVDGGSQDRTVALARQLCVQVFSRLFDDFANQKNFAVSKATQDWVFSLDADETPSEKLMESVSERVSRTGGVETAYRVRRRNFHFGRELKWGGQGNDFPVRLFRKHEAPFRGQVHEHVDVKGKVGQLGGELLHESNQAVDGYLVKLVRYSELEAIAARRKRSKTSFWHCGLRPALRFVYTYFIQLGFLDGFEGFLFHALSSFYLVVKEVRLAEESGTL